MLLLCRFPVHQVCPVLGRLDGADPETLPNTKRTAFRVFGPTNTYTTRCEDGNSLSMMATAPWTSNPLRVVVHYYIFSWPVIRIAFDPQHAISHAFVFVLLLESNLRGCF